MYPSIFIENSGIYSSIFTERTTAMRCKNFCCIYNQNASCTSENLLIDQYGTCADCVYPQKNIQPSPSPFTGKILVGAVSIPVSGNTNFPAENNARLEQFIRKLKKIKK